MSCAYLTDQDIEDICAGRPNANQMRRDLRKQRFTDQVAQQLRRRHERAAQEEACHRAEEEMTDAGKAVEDFPPHASPFPTEAQLSNVNRVGMSLAVSAEMMAGKTTLLLFLLEAMTDAGMLSGPETKAITLDPMRFLSTKRTTNDQNVEVIDLDLDLNEAIEQMKLAKAVREPQSPAILAGEFEVDALLVGLTGWENTLRGAVQEMVKHPRLNHADEIVLRFRKV